MMKGVYARGKGFQAKYRRKGYDPVTGSFPTEKAAEAWMLECAAASLLGKPLPSVEASVVGPEKMTIQALFERVDRKRWRGNPKAKSGALGSCANAIRFIKWTGPNLPAVEALTEELIAEFVEYREDEHENSGSTINRYLAALSALAEEAVKLKLIQAKPDMPKRSEGGFRLRIFTEAEENDILVTARQWGYEDLADWFVFLSDMGCRPKEGRLLTWRDINDGRIYLDETITKNGTERNLKATKRVLEVLARMREKHGDLAGPFAWINAKLHAPRVLWDRLRVHLEWMDHTTIIYTYRHTCASRLVQRGMGLPRVQIWMGHKTPSMTMRYAKFEPRHMDDCADALESEVAPVRDNATLDLLKNFPPHIIQAMVEHLGLGRGT